MLPAMRITNRRHSFLSHVGSFLGRNETLTQRTCLLSGKTILEHLFDELAGRDARLSRSFVHESLRCLGELDRVWRHRDALEMDLPPHARGQVELIFAQRLCRTTVDFFLADFSHLTSPKNQNIVKHSVALGVLKYLEACFF